jgi:hypothetical protein
VAARAARSTEDANTGQGTAAGGPPATALTGRDKVKPNLADASARARAAPSDASARARADLNEAAAARSAHGATNRNRPVEGLRVTGYVSE